MKIQRKDAESAKGYEDNEQKEIKKSQILWISAFFASSRLCARFYDVVIRGRGTSCSIKCKPIALFY